jgi:hypothetical protein
MPPGQGGGIPCLAFARFVQVSHLEEARPTSKPPACLCPYLGNKYRRAALATIREHFGVQSEEETESTDQTDDEEEVAEESESDEATLCPECGKGRLGFSHHLRRPTVNEIYCSRWQDLLSKDAVIEQPDLSEEFALSGELEFW